MEVKVVGELIVDIVLCIDATASMEQAIERVKRAAMSFHEELRERLGTQQKQVGGLRVKVLAFRDVLDNGEHAFEETPFFTLPQEKVAFHESVSKLSTLGNTTYPESGLSALSVAMLSDWNVGGLRRRHIIVLWTDDQAHPLESEWESVPNAYRDRMVSSLDALSDVWHDYQGGAGSKRLVLFAPGGGVWDVIAESFDRVVHVPSVAGSGVGGVQLDAVFDSIVNSV